MSSCSSSSGSCLSLSDLEDLLDKPDYVLEPKYQTMEEKLQVEAQGDFQAAIPDELPKPEPPLTEKEIPDEDLLCPCMNCRSQTKDEENSCCRSFGQVTRKLQAYEDDAETKVMCVTALPEFANFVMNEDVLRNCYRFFREQFTGQTDPNRLYRYVAYRNYTSMIHGVLGRGKRIPIPACVYHRIRSQFPSRSFQGFSAI